MTILAHATRDLFWTKVQSFALLNVRIVKMEIAQRLKNAPVTKGSICHLTENVSITVAKDVEMEIAWRLMFAIVIKDIQW